MDLINWIEGFIEKMKWYDISLIKGSVFFATLFLITACPVFLEFVMRFEWYWYLILMIVFMFPLLKRIFK